MAEAFKMTKEIPCRVTLGMIGKKSGLLIQSSDPACDVLPFDMKLVFVLVGKKSQKNKYHVNFEIVQFKREKK